MLWVALCTKPRDRTVYVVGEGTYSNSKKIKKLNADEKILENAADTDVEHGFMYQTQDGTIYVGTRFKGLKKLKTDGTGLEKINDTLDKINVASGFMYQTRDGTVYVGTYKQGLYKLNAARDGLVKVDKTDDTNGTNVKAGFMYQTRNGTVYVGTFEQGLYKLNAARDGLVGVANTNVGGGFMYQTRDGTIYVGTNHEGLKKLNATKDGLKDVAADIDVGFGWMYQTRDGTIYVGTNHEGLKKLNADGNSLEKISDTLDNTDVEHDFMHQARDGTIYVGAHNKGLKKLNADGKILEDVANTDVSHGFMYQTRDGTIYVGTYHKGLKRLPYTVNRTLASDSDCTINYFIPKGITVKKTSVLTAYGDNADNSGTAALLVTISPAVSQGRFVFENGNGKSITNLDLKPGDSGVVLLRNVGKANIKNVKLNGLLATDSLHFVSKCFPSGQNQPLISLKSGDSCTFFYSVADESPNTNFILSPTGIGADNSGTARLTVNVSSTGHFVFRNTDGNDMNALYLKPDDKGTVVLHNTGQANITGFTLTSKSSTIISKTSSTCFSANTLKTGSSCTIDYAVPAAASVTAETFTLTAKGTNADNNDTAKLPVTVSKEANLVFRNLSGQVITHLDLNVGQNTGTILLQNTGGTAVTNLTQKGLPPATMGTCFLKFGGTYLDPGSSCSMNYGPFNIAHHVTLTAIGYTSGKPITATLKINISRVVHAIFRKNKQQITDLDLNPVDITTFVMLLLLFCFCVAI